MKRNDLLTPEGTRDYLFREAAAKRIISRRITNIFDSFGYSDVITPGIEFYDVFNGNERSFPQESMYKLVDGKNRLMVLRPDSTLPIARLYATRLYKEQLPLKLFYNQSIFLVNPKDSGRDDEISQCGLEIIGGNEESMDYEALYLGYQALKSCSNKGFRFEIGDSGIFRELISQYDCDEQQAELIRNGIETKNYPLLESILTDSDDNVAKALKALPHLFGGMEVFDEAQKYLNVGKLGSKLLHLKCICEDLSKIIPSDIIRVDLGLVHKKSYYTGIIFRGYIEGYGQPILSGGRYDNLLKEFGKDEKAVGFAVNVEAAARVLIRTFDTEEFEQSTDVLVYSKNKIEALKYCDELYKNGLRVKIFEEESLEKALKFARENNIPKLVLIDENGNVQSREV